jgi:hypothetical protein
MKGRNREILRDAPLPIVHSKQVSNIKGGI